MMKVLGKYYWQGAVLILLVSFIGVAVQSQSTQGTAATLKGLQSQVDTLMAVHQWEAAIPILHEALQVSRATENEEEEARVLSLLGECYRQAELLGRALTYYEQARAAYVALEMATSPEMAVVLFGTAKTQASLGHFSEALDALHETQEIFKDQDQPRKEAIAWHELGQIFSSLGRCEDAFASYQQALGLYQVHGGLIDTIVIYQDMGRVLVQEGEYEEALNRFYKVLSIAQKTAYTDAIAEAYVGISSVYSALGRYGDALNALGQAESLYKDQGAWLELANIQLRYAELCSVLGRYEPVSGYYGKAVEYLKMALSKLERISPVAGMRYSRPVTRLQILLRIGMCLETLEEWDDTVQTYQSAVEVIESMPWLTNDEANGVYQRLIPILARLGRRADALVYAERWRACMLRDAIYGVSPRLPGSPEVEAINCLVAPGSISQAIATAQQYLEPNEAVLEYMVTDTGIYLWVITTDGISDPIFIEYAREQLISDVISLRKTRESPFPDTISLYEFLASFYDKLVKPGLTGLPDGVDTLILIPSGPLWYLPFSSLIMTDQADAEGLGTYYPYLVEKFAVAYLPSLASLPTLMAGGPDEAGAFVEFSKLPMRYPGLESSIAVLAQCLTEDEQHVSIYVGDDATESKLKAECSDAGFLMLLCCGRTDVHVPLLSEILLAEDKDNDGHLHAWEVLQLDLKNTELVVLPGVATLLPVLQKPTDTLFNPEPRGRVYYAVDRGAPTIQVASSQEVSGEATHLEFLKDPVSGEDVTIWPLTFLSVGAKSVLQTLWLANPEVLEKLLVAMGNYCKGGNTWAKALAKAQCDLIKDATFSDAWLWAPYQLIGRWR